MFGRWSSKAAEDVEGHALSEVVGKHLPEADSETRRIVTAIAGLLGGVAYADRDYSPAEEAHLRIVLGRVNGVGAAGIDAVLGVLKSDIIAIATVQSPRYCRTLVELGDRELRLQVLGMLIEVAAADHHISHEEVVLLRNTTRALGLEQSDYNDLQAPHRAKLGSLK